MTTARRDLGKVSRQLFEAIEAHDVDTVASLLADGAVGSRNGGLEWPLRAFTDPATYDAAVRQIGRHRYEEVRQVIGDGAVAEQHRVRSTKPDGTQLDIDVCVVVQINGEGLVTRLDEYADTSARGAEHGHEEEGMATVGYEFASREWIAALHGYLVANTPDFTKLLGGGVFSICEVYTDVPPSVSRAERVAVSWGFEDGSLDFDTRERDDVVIKVVADWATVAPLARTVFADDPDEAAKAAEAMRRGSENGTFRVTRNGEPPRFLARVHDDLARLTR